MAHFDRAIPPGGEGKITLQLDTTGFQGPISKSASVHSNDPAAGVLKLTVTADVKVPVFVSSRHVFLQGLSGETLSRTIEVRAELDRPLQLTVSEFTLTGTLVYALREIEPGRRFEILIAALPLGPQSFSGFLKLKTNYPERPEIIIDIRGRIGAKS